MHGSLQDKRMFMLSAISYSTIKIVDHTSPSSIQKPDVEFYLYLTVGTVLIHSIKPELTE